MNSMRRNMSAAVVACLTFVVSACNPAPPASSNAPAAKTTSNPVRHELEPLTKRFPALGSPVSASWVSGDMGDPRVPGSSRYWIDAIVEVSPATADGLKATHRPLPTADRPDVWETLRDVLPQGGFLASDQLDAAFTSTKISGHVFLAADAPVVVITATGE
jgi:hypothetical protein